MNFDRFILAHDAEDPATLAMSRKKLEADVDDFDLAITTLEVRKKLRSKVPEWYAVPGLEYPLRLSGEQCSSSETAAYKAKLAGSPSVLADLTGGLGVDSWAFSKVAGKVFYNEMNPSLAAAASHNFALLGADNITVLNNEITPSNVAGILAPLKPDVIFMDPARRAEDGRKVFRLEDCQPNVLELLPTLFSISGKILLKLSPMADISLVCKQLGSVREVHVVSADGECKELLLVLERGYKGEYSLHVYEGGAVAEIPASEAPSSVYSEPVEGQILFEPGKGLLKAGAFDFPCHYGMGKLGRHTHLYVGSVPESLKPFGKSFEILQVLPFNNKSIKELKKDYPRAEVTARNIPLTSDALRKKIGCTSGGGVHIFGVHVDALDGNFILICSVPR